MKNGMIRPWAAIRLTIYVGAILLGLLSGFVAQANNGAGRVDLLDVRGPVTPSVKGYILRGIEEAEQSGSRALIVRLDTPGGSVDLTKDIAQSMLMAQVPIIVYIAPAGAHAASAGTFITLAGHLAAMAPGTSIGAASPVSGSGEELPETSREKAVAILEADIKGLAQRRGEAATEWAAAAVREARAATAEEALEIGVIDVIAGSLTELLEKVDGMEVQIAGETVVLETAGAAINDLPMTAVEDFLHTITNPNIAFILMTLGLNGILFELSNPGGYVAGVIGGICLLLALYALGVLSVNYTGLLFIVLAFALFLLELQTPTFGALTLGGVASFVFGSLILFSSPYAQVSVTLVITVGVATGAFFAFVLAKAVRSHKAQPATGSEGLIGAVAVVRKRLAPVGNVFVKGELWEASVEGEPVEAGERVVVLGREGLRLLVEALPTEALNSSPAKMGLRK